MSRRIGLMLLGLVCWAVVAGCASKRVNLVEAGKAQLDVVQGQAVEILGVTVEQGKKDVHVSGLVRDVMASGHLSNGHIDVEVVRPDGQIVSRDAVHLPLWRTQRPGPDYRFFHADVPGPLAEGAAVRVRYGIGEHGAACKGNG